MGIGTPFTMIGTATRHMLDINLAFGMPSEQYNARDKYRNEYSNEQRASAGIGVALGTALPAMGLGTWALKRGLKAPLAPVGMLPQGAAKAAGIAALGAATAVGVSKMYQITKDDGHVGALASTAGIVAGTLGGLKLGQKFAGRYAPIVSGAAAIGLGIAGYQVGKRISVGPGEIGKPHPKAPTVDEFAGDRVTSFLRGGVTSFTESGPTSQGVAFSSWGMNDAFKNKYSNSERAGAMLLGDLGAAAILGGGALGVAGGLMRGNVAGAADAAGAVLAKGPLLQQVSNLSGKGVAGIAAAGVGITGLVAMKQYQQSIEHGQGGTRAALEAAGIVGATAGTAALVSKSRAFSGLGGGAKAAAGMLTAAALIAVLSSARIPVQQFVNDAKLAHEVRKPDPVTAAVAGGGGAVLGGVGAFKTFNKMVPAGGIQIGKFRIPKAVLVGAATLVGAGAVGGAGYGLSATMPDIKKVALAGGAGAAVGAGAGVLLGGVGVKAGVAAGAMLGVAGSALLVDEPVKSLPVEDLGAVATGS